MIIKSDWHIHTENSYDATLPLTEILENAKKYGFEKIGITDHLNFNDERFLTDLKNSSEEVKKMQKDHPELILGVELTPIEKPEFDYVAKTGTRDGYVAPDMDEPYEIALPLTKEELKKFGVRYAVGASHWRVDVPTEKELASDVDSTIREWYRQQLWLACDERVTILGHPWYHGQALWYDDFSRIPRSMNMDNAHALKENKKYVECNSAVILNPRTTEKYRMQYVEFLRELFEMGIPVTYGSDSHLAYQDLYLKMEEYLRNAGFVDGDFSHLMEEDLW